MSESRQKFSEIVARVSSFIDVLLDTSGKFDFLTEILRFTDQLHGVRASSVFSADQDPTAISLSTHASSTVALHQYIADLLADGSESFHCYFYAPEELPVNSLPVNISGLKQLVVISENITGEHFALLMFSDATENQEVEDLLPALLRNVFKIYYQKFVASDSLYRFLVENQNELIVKVDNQNRFLYVSPSYCRMFGLNPDQLLGKSYEPLIHPDDLEPTRIEVAKLMHQPHTCYIEQRAKTVDGWRWLSWHDKAFFDEKGQIESVIGVGRDITLEKTMTTELHESEQKFQKAFRSSPNLMLLTRLSDGAVFDINDRFAELLNMKREQIIGRTTPDLGLYTQSSRADMMELLLKNGMVQDKEFTVKTADNQILVGLFSAELTELNGEKFLVSSFNDISELKKTQRELETIKVQLEQLVEKRTAQLSEINDELNRFARNVSHDLRAPLRVLEAYSNALASDYNTKLGDDGADLINRMLGAIQQMGNLISDLLTYAQLSSLELNMSAVNPVDSLHKCLALLSADIREKGATIIIPENLPAVMAYKPVLVQVFSNLISNSLKFVKANVKPEIEVSAETKGEWVALYFSDNGIGIPEEMRNRIFEVYERLHGVESYPGTGIGLTIVKKAMLRMGGDVKVLSTGKKGSIFELRFVNP